MQEIQETIKKGSEIYKITMLPKIPDLVFDTGKPMPRRVKNATIHVKTKFEGVGRNLPCPCQSGKKHKTCCFRKID
jgi:uncharacterized protein YecA (UPF0149 family)